MLGRKVGDTWIRPLALEWSMRIVTAGDSQALVNAFHALHVVDSTLNVVGEAHSEGELFQVARSQQPEIILLDWAFRPRFTAAWAAYLSEISGGARVVAIYGPLD